MDPTYPGHYFSLAVTTATAPPGQRDRTSRLLCVYSGCIYQHLWKSCWLWRNWITSRNRAFVILHSIVARCRNSTLIEPLVDTWNLAVEWTGGRSYTREACKSYYNALKKEGKLTKAKEAITAYIDIKHMAKHSVCLVKSEAEKEELSTVSLDGVRGLRIYSQTDGLHKPGCLWELSISAAEIGCPVAKCDPWILRATQGPFGVQWIL